MRVVRLPPEADQMVVQASEWWHANRPAAPDLFDQEFSEAKSRIAESPEVGRRYRRRGIPGLRRWLLQRTRYHVYYVHDAEEDQIIVLAVWSAVRGRGPRLRVP